MSSSNHYQIFEYDINISLFYLCMIIGRWFYQILHLLNHEHGESLHEWLKPIHVHRSSALLRLNNYACHKESVWVSMQSWCSRTWKQCLPRTASGASDTPSHFSRGIKPFGTLSSWSMMSPAFYADTYGPTKVQQLFASKYEPTSFPALESSSLFHKPA